MNGTLTATFVTFSDNTAKDGASNAQDGTDIYVLSDDKGDTGVNGTHASVILIDDVLGQATSETSDFVAMNENGSTPTMLGEYDLISNNSPTLSGGTAFGGSHLSSGNPMLAGLASNGGPTQTMALLTGSQAIAAGVSADYPGTMTAITTDQRGAGRPPAPSMGAFESVPYVSGLSPASGPVAGGTTVIITGTNFTGATAVNFGTTAAESFVVLNETTITAVAPAGSAGTVNVFVTTPNSTSQAVATDQFTYASAPASYVVTSTDYNPAEPGTLAFELATAIAFDDNSIPITFDLPDNSTIALTSGDLDPLSTYGPTAYIVSGTGTAITIDGSAAPGLTIDGGGAVRLFQVSNPTSLTLENLTVAGGMAAGGTGGESQHGGGGGGGGGLGGAIYNDGGYFTALGVTFTNNVALGGAGGSIVSGAGDYGGGGGGGVNGGDGFSGNAGGTPGSTGAGRGGTTGTHAPSGGFGGGGGGGYYHSGDGGQGGFGGGGGGGGSSEFGHPGYGSYGGFGGGTGGTVLPRRPVEAVVVAALASVGASSATAARSSLVNDTFTDNQRTGGAAALAVAARPLRVLATAAPSSLSTARSPPPSSHSVATRPRMAAAMPSIAPISMSSADGIDPGVNGTSASVTLTDDILGQATSATSDFVADYINGGSIPAMSGQYDLISNNSPDDRLPNSSGFTGMNVTECDQRRTPPLSARPG